MRLFLTIESGNQSIRWKWWAGTLLYSFTDFFLTMG
jgi:hypothetical protein